MKSMMPVVLLLLSLSAQAQLAPKSFDEIWGQFYQKSLKQKSVMLEKDAHEQSLARAQRHWLPRAFVGGQWFSTNDPTQVFFNHLGQRSIEQADFMPADLNRPGRETFRAAALGIDLPLYEGGMKASQSSMYEALVKASDLELRAKRSEEYAELARHYGGLLILTQNENLLNELKLNLGKVIANYQVGAQSNPVGYSGLLGLKGVVNRIEGLLVQYELKITNSREWINSKIEHTDLWKPEVNESVSDFLATKLSSGSHVSSSSLLQAQEMKLKTLEEMKNMERARFLPRLGLFAQNHFFDGDRDSATSQSYGLYLQWDLFNPDSYGRVGEAQAKKLAEETKLKSYKQEERIMLSNLSESKVALEKTLKVLSNSDSLLQEQSSNAMKLFRSGMLNALQLAEVINRRVDLVENKLAAETQYLDVWSRLYQLNN
jgi:outer membrane protein TolC